LSTYEAVAAEANAAGFRVNNTFQTGEGWRANLHDGKEGFIFAHGDTPTEALRLALKYALAEKGAKPVKIDEFD